MGNRSAHHRCRREFHERQPPNLLDGSSLASTDAALLCLSGRELLFLPGVSPDRTACRHESPHAECRTLPWGYQNIASSQAADAQIPIAGSPAITPSVHPAVSSLGASPTPAHRHRHIRNRWRVRAGIGQPLTNPAVQLSRTVRPQSDLLLSFGALFIQFMRLELNEVALEHPRQSPRAITSRLSCRHASLHP